MSKADGGTVLYVDGPLYPDLFGGETPIRERVLVAGGPSESTVRREAPADPGNERTRGSRLRGKADLIP